MIKIKILTENELKTRPEAIPSDTNVLSEKYVAGVLEAKADKAYPEFEGSASVTFNSTGDPNGNSVFRVNDSYTGYDIINVTDGGYVDLRGASVVRVPTAVNDNSPYQKIQVDNLLSGLNIGAKLERNILGFYIYDTLPQAGNDKGGEVAYENATKSLYVCYLAVDSGFGWYKINSAMLVGNLYMSNVDDWYICLQSDDSTILIKKLTEIGTGSNADNPDNETLAQLNAFKNQFLTTETGELILDINNNIITTI